MDQALSYRPRLYRLVSWLVRALIPPGLSGSYVLYTDGQPTYAGRSDRDLRNRLVDHARADRAEYFDFEVLLSAAQAYTMEAAYFHALDELHNIVHPAIPSFSGESCPFCPESVNDVRLHRLVHPDHLLGGATSGEDFDDGDN